MPLHDPVAIYNAANNLEALFVRDALIAARVEAFVIEDVSQIGTWVGGLVPEIHRPQVWVERADIERAKPTKRCPSHDGCGGDWRLPTTDLVFAASHRRCR